MSRVPRHEVVIDHRQRSNSSGSFSGLLYQPDVSQHDKNKAARRRESQCASSKSLVPLEERSDEQPQNWNCHSRPSLDELGKENIKRPSNEQKKKSPQQFFERENELSKIRRSKKQLQAAYQSELTRKEEQLAGLFQLKEENRMNLDELSKLRHLTSQFEVQLRKLNKEKQQCEQNLTEALAKAKALSDDKPLLRLQEQYELMFAENREKIQLLEAEVKSLSDSLEAAGRQNQLLRSELADRHLQPSQQQKFNEYVARASEAQNRANELQIRYFRIQKENDENKQAKEEAEYELKELRVGLQSQKQLFQEQEDKLLARIKTLESERRRSEIERTNQLHEKDVLFNKIRKEKEAEIDKLRLELDTAIFEAQEAEKAARCQQISRDSDAKSYKIALQSLELQYRKARSELEEIAQKKQSESEQLRTELDMLQQESVDHVEVIELLQKKLESAKLNKDSEYSNLHSEYERQLEAKNSELEQAKHEIDQRQESMARYSRQIESIKHELRSILEERDVVLHQLEAEIEDKDNRIAELERYCQAKQCEFQRHFDDLKIAIQGSQAKTTQYRAELDRRDSIIATHQQSLRQYQQQLASLRMNLETSLVSNKDLQEELNQITRLFTQTKVDMSSLRQSFQQDTTNKQGQLSKLLEMNEQLQQQNNKLSSLHLVLKERSQHLEEECVRISKATEQQQQKNKELLAELTSHRTAVQRLREQLHQLTQLRQNDQLQFGTQRQQIAEEAAKNSAAKLQSMHNSQLQLLRAEAAVLRSQQTSLSEDLAKKQKYICMLEAENRKSQASLMSYVRSNNEQKEQIESKDSELEQRRKELSARQEQASMLRNKLQEVECRLETCNLELSTEKQIGSTLRHEIIMLRQLEENLKQSQQSKVNQYAQSEQERKQLQLALEQKNMESAQLTDRCRQFDQIIRQLNDKINGLNMRLIERDCMLAQLKKSADGKSAELDGMRKQGEQALQEKRQLQQRLHELTESINSREQQHSAKATSELQQLRKTLESVVTEYESLRVAHQSSSNRLLAMKSERDARTVQVQQGRMRIRILESENRSIHQIMTEQLQKRKRIIESLVREKNCAVGDLQRSKISWQ